MGLKRLHLFIFVFFLGFSSHKRLYCRVTGKKEDEPTPCEECGKVLSSKEGLRKHMQRFHHIGKAMVQCEQCGKDFSKQCYLKAHIVQVHSRKTCEHCGKSVLNELFLKKHLVFDHGITAGAFICDICPKTMFLSETGYSKHVQEKHTFDHNTMEMKSKPKPPKQNRNLNLPVLPQLQRYGL